MLQPSLVVPWHKTGDELASHPFYDITLTETSFDLCYLCLLKLPTGVKGRFTIVVILGFVLPGFLLPQNHYTITGSITDRESAWAVFDNEAYNSDGELTYKSIHVEFLEKVNGEWKIVYFSMVNTSSYEEEVENETEEIEEGEEEAETETEDTE